jgi:hypothetical protein
MTNPNQIPYVPQSLYARSPYGQFPGDVWEGDLLNERQSRGLIAAVTPVSQVTDVLIASNTPSDDVGVYIDGALFFVVAGASAGATALLLETELEGAALLASIVSTVTVDTATVTITFADDQPHTVEEYSPATTTATPTDTTDAVSQQRLRFGYGVARQATGESINTTKVVRPTSLTDDFAGVLVRTSTSLPNTLVLALNEDYDASYLPPGYAYTLAQRDLGVCVEYVGTAPTETDDVYWICTGTDAGKWRADDGSTSQVTQGDVEFNATDDVGLIVDGFGPLFVASNTSDDQTATDLRDAWNADPAFAAIATASIDLSGAESYIVLTFLDDQAHTVTAYSPATADITSITNTTTAVAASAQLKEHLSWGRPTNTAGEEPCAYLRLNNP